MILYYFLITTMACRLYGNSSHDYSCTRQFYWGIDLCLLMRQILVSSRRCLFPLSSAHSSPSLPPFLPSNTLHPLLFLHLPPFLTSNHPSFLSFLLPASYLSTRYRLGITHLLDTSACTHSPLCTGTP